MALILLISAVGIYFCCKYAKSSYKIGFVLQEFNVINPKLDSIISIVQKQPKILAQDDDVIVLILRDYDSKPEFCFTSCKSLEVSEKYIYNNTRRIVGYIDNPVPIIILSDVLNIYDFEAIFYKFLRPTIVKRRFEYLYFPDNQYYADVHGAGKIPSFFDPYFYVFSFDGDSFEKMNYYDN